MELTEPAAEAGGGDEAAPGLADEGGAGEALRFGRREAEEDLLDELFHQRPCRRRRLHADWLESDPAGGELGLAVQPAGLGRVPTEVRICQVGPVVQRERGRNESLLEFHVLSSV